MAKVIARKPDAHLSESKSISFSRDEKTGHYKKTEQNMKCNHLEHTSKKDSKPKVAENLYKLSDNSDWDYKFDITGPDGSPQTIYFKEIE